MERVKRVARVRPSFATTPSANSAVRTHWLGQLLRYAVALAGHTNSSGETGATTTYVRASLTAVAAALAALTSEPHPLATTEEW